jgi:hypothetical protein
LYSGILATGQVGEDVGRGFGKMERDEAPHRSLCG